MQLFTVKRLCLCSRSWMFGGRNQSGRWDLLIHPFEPGSSCHLQRAVLWTLFPQAKLLLTHCSQEHYSCEPSVTQGLCLHCLLKATLWSLTGPSSSASHIDGLQALTLLHSQCPQSIPVPRVPSPGQMLSCCQVHSHSPFIRQPHGSRIFFRIFHSSWTQAKAWISWTIINRFCWVKYELREGKSFFYCTPNHHMPSEIHILLEYFCTSTVCVNFLTSCLTLHCVLDPLR